MERRHPDHITVTRTAVKFYTLTAPAFSVYLYVCLLVGFIGDMSLQWLYCGVRRRRRRRRRRL